MKRMISLFLTLSLALTMMPTHLILADEMPVTEIVTEAETPAPTDPSETPEEPSAPVTPAETPEEPSAPVTPAETPEEPSVPTDPAETPEEPSVPTDPAETPEEPSAPTDPAETPEEPVAPIDPAQTIEEPVAQTEDAAGLLAITPKEDPLPKPTGLAVSRILFYRVDLSWDAVAGATQYEVQYRASTTTTFTSAGTFTGTSGYVDVLTCGVLYYFRVRAVKVVGSTTTYSEFSSLCSATPKPAAPATVTLTQVSSTSAKLAWSAVSGANGYRIYRSMNGEAFSLLKTFTGNTTLDYTDTGLLIGATYVYEVCAYRTVNGIAVEGELSNPEQIVMMPVAPTGLKATVDSANSIKLSWNAVAGVTSYNVLRASSAGGTYSTIASAVTATTYTDTGLVTGSTYYYKVASVCGSGEAAVVGAPTDAISATPSMTVPTGLKVSASTSSSITLAWTAIPLATGYYVEWATVAAGPFTRITIADNVSGYTHTGLDASKLYYYRVISYVNVGGTPLESPASTIVAGATNPTTPSELTGEMVNFYYGRLRWTGDSDVDGYEIYRSTDGTNFTRLTTVSNVHLYNDTSLITGTKYSYQLRAFKTVGGVIRYSSMSKVVDITPLTLAPQGVIATVKSGTSVQVDWGDVSGASGYNVYKRVKGVDEFTLAGSVSGRSTLKLVVNGLTCGQEMEFRVAAYRTVSGSNIVGEYSGLASAKTMPAKPTNFNAYSVDDVTIQMSWTIDTSAAGYDVFYAPTADHPASRDDMTLLGSATVGAYTASNMEPGILYTFLVAPYVTVTGTKEYGESSDMMENVYARPVKPTDFAAASLSDHQALLTWKATTFHAEGETGYEIQYSDDGGANYHKLIDIVDAAVRYTDSTVAVGATRMYRIRSYVNFNGNKVLSVFTDPVSVTTKPRTGTDLSLTSTGSSNITLRFVGSAQPVTYLVYRSTSATSGFSCIASVTGTTTALEYSDDTVTLGTTYYYRVRPFAPSGGVNYYGDYSSTVSGSSQPAAPAGLAVSGYSTTAAKLTWTAAPGASGYQVYRSLSETSGFAYIGTVSGNAYINAGLTIGTTYYYRVRTYQTLGGTNVYSPLCESASYKCAPVSPTNLKLVSTTYNSATISWTAVAGVTNYTLTVTRDGSSTPYTVGASATSYTLTGLQIDEIVSVSMVSNCMVGGETMTSTPASTLDFLVRPAPVSDLSATINAAGNVTLQWSSVVGAVQYELQKSDDGVTFTVLTTVTENSTSDYLADFGAVRYYRIRPVSAGRYYGSLSSAVSVARNPAVPTNLALELVNFNFLRLTWDVVAGATGYQVYRSTAATTGFTLIGTTPSLLWSDNTLESGKTYYYRVRAYVDSVNGTYFSADSATVSGKAVPVKAEGLTAVPNTTTSAKLSWSAVSGANGYEVSYKLSTDSTYTVLSFTTALTTICSPLSVGKTYQFRVRAYRIVSGTRVYGEYSDAVSLKQDPPTPTNVNAASSGATSVTVTWNACSGVDGYAVYASSASGGTYTLKGKVTTNSMRLTGLTAGVPVYIKVRSYAGTSESADSTVVNATPIPAATTVRISSATSTSVTLTWAAVSGASGYVVYRKDTASGSFYELGRLINAGVTQYKDATVTAGTCPFYMVRAFVSTDGGDVQSADSNIVYNVIRPIAPTITVKETNAVSVTLSWAATDVTRILIYRSTKASSGWSCIDAVEGTATQYVDYSVTGGTTYYYRVRPYTYNGVENIYAADYSNTVSGMAQPPKPTNVEAVAASYNSVEITWDSVRFCYSYRIYMRTSPTGTATLLRTVGNVNSYTATGLVTGQTYYFEVRALRGAGISLASAQAKCAATLPAPTNFTANGLSGSKVKLTFTAVTGATTYQVYRSTSETGPWTLVTTQNSTTITLTNQPAGTAYYYRARAVRTASGVTSIGVLCMPEVCYPMP